MTTPRTGDQRAALGPAVLVALTSTVAVVALSQRWWWAFGVCTALSVVLLAAALRGLHAGRLARPSSRRVETVRRWLMTWPFGMAMCGSWLWPEAGQPGRSVAVVVHLLVWGAALSAIYATQVHWTADDPTLSRLHRLPWRRRLRLDRAIRRGAVRATVPDRDVRAVADRMTRWEVAGAMAGVLSLSMGVLAATLYLDRGSDATLFGVLSVALAAAAVYVLRGCAAARRRTETAS